MELEGSDDLREKGRVKGILYVVWINQTVKCSGRVEVVSACGNLEFGSEGEQNSPP